MRPTRRPSLALTCLLLSAALGCSALAACKREAPREEPRRTEAPVETAAPAPPAADTADATAAASPPSVVGPDDPRVQALMKKKAEEERMRRRFADVPLDEPLSPEQLKTTSCSIFLGNLDGRITQMKKQLEARPDDAGLRRGYAAELFGRAQIMGSLEGIAEAIAVLDAGLEETPDDPALRLDRARMRMTLHRFDDARADLEAVRKSAPTTAGLEALAEQLDLETGRDLPTRLEAMTTAFEKQATFDTYVAAASAHEQLGHLALAGKLYGRAERSFADVAPIPLAWLGVQRGLMAMHAGDYERAKRFFDTAYQRCPAYPMAAEHLAEIEGRLGNTARAIELYEAVIEQTRNPEFMAALGELLLETGGDEARAKALFERADKRNRELIERFPEAMAGHGADFYLGPGNDPKLAYTLLKSNHTLRPTPTAAQALAEAELAVGKLDEAAATIETALKSPVEFAEKHWTAARIALARGDQAAADAHAARARELNPKIEDLEGPLRDEPAPTTP